MFQWTHVRVACACTCRYYCAEWEKNNILKCTMPSGRCHRRPSQLHDACTINNTNAMASLRRRRRRHALLYFIIHYCVWRVEPLKYERIVQSVPQQLYPENDIILYRLFSSSVSSLCFFFVGLYILFFTCPTTPLTPQA